MSLTRTRGQGRKSVNRKDMGRLGPSPSVRIRIASFVLPVNCGNFVLVHLYPHLVRLQEHRLGRLEYKRQKVPHSWGTNKVKNALIFPVIESMVSTNRKVKRIADFSSLS